VNVFPRTLFEVGGVAISDSVVTSLAITAILVLGGVIALRFRGARLVLEVTYELLERTVRETVAVDARPLVPLILSLWAFIGLANLAGLVPGVGAPTRDLSLTVALALIAFAAGHVVAFRRYGIRYLRQYLEPNPFMLPLNIIGEASRTLALALRLFGNMMSGQLIGAIIVYVAGLLLPVPLLILGVLTSVVQAYIFGILTLVFAASALQALEHSREKKKKEPA
jgi:F-type H+-transporting ATPase subunit a